MHIFTVLRHVTTKGFADLSHRSPFVAALCHALTSRLMHLLWRQWRNPWKIFTACCCSSKNRRSPNIESEGGSDWSVHFFWPRVHLVWGVMLRSHSNYWTIQRQCVIHFLGLDHANTRYCKLTMPFILPFKCLPSPLLLITAIFLHECFHSAVCDIHFPDTHWKHKLCWRTLDCPVPAYIPIIQKWHDIPQHFYITQSDICLIHNKYILQYRF